MKLFKYFHFEGLLGFTTSQNAKITENMECRPPILYFINIYVLIAIF